tara:strand:+ start:845 stop:1357 length:513 start_codon:yes stop_codon:yes gene_type:complete
MPQASNTSSDTGWLKDLSDVADKDNVYLSDRGWVYRHYKGDGTAFWDEVIIAGEVPASDSPAAFGAASPTFLTGDGDAAPVENLTAISIRGLQTATNGVAESYLTVVTSSNISDETYLWTSSDGSATFSAGTAANTTVTFSTAGDFTLTCTATSVTAGDTVSDTITVTVS